MPYNERIEARINKAVSGWGKTTSKKMFGGVCHLLRGNMFCGVYRDFLILRLGEEGAGEALRREHVRPFDITGRPMKGWVMVGLDGFRTEESLRRWLDTARDFAMTLPSK
jgi:hypothetical protein